MLRTTHNEVLAALYRSDIAYLRQHLFCSKFHSIKIRECHKKKVRPVQHLCFQKIIRSVWLSVTNITMLQTGDLKEFSGSTLGIRLHWKLQREQMILNYLLQLDCLRYPN